MQRQLQVAASKVSLPLYFPVSVSLPPSPVTCKEPNPADSHRSSEANPSPPKLSRETPILADNPRSNLVGHDLATPGAPTLMDKNAHDDRSVFLKADSCLVGR